MPRSCATSPSTSERRRRCAKANHAKLQFSNPRSTPSSGWISTRELEHRSNNLLAVIQAIAHRSLSGHGSLDQARTTFEARLHTLARMHHRLTKSNWTGLRLTDVMRSELEPFAARTKIDGANVVLTPQQAQNFSLAV